MNTSPRLLGIDIGTSGLKVCLFDETGRLLARAYRESRYLELPSGHKEQRAEEWWDHLCAASREVLEKTHLPAAAIAGIGICGFHHCPVFLKEGGNPSRSVLLLHDERLSQSRDALAQSGALAKVEALTHSLVSAGHFPPIYHYVHTHDHDALERTRWILLAKDYLRFRLTGEIGTEICDATGTNLIMPEAATWSAELCDLLSVPMKCLPEIACPTDLAGSVTSEAAERTGLRAGTPVVYGGGDSHCALLGLGCTDAGALGLLLGTNSTLRAVFDRFVSHPETKLWVQHHVVPSRYTVSASSMAGASVVQWFLRCFSEGRSDCGTNALNHAQSYEELEQLAAAVPPGSEGILFTPYIHGERVPFYDPDASGAFVGLRHRHRREHMLRGVLEGIALNIAVCHDLITECARPHGVRLAHPRLGGGGSQIALWQQIIADCLGQPISVMHVREAGALGAALLAGIGVGIYADDHEAVSAAVREEAVIEPDPANRDTYRELKEKLNDVHRRLQ